MNIQNKVVYENLRKLEKQNNGKGCLLLFIIAVIIIFGLYEIINHYNDIKIYNTKSIVDNGSNIKNNNYNNSDNTTNDEQINRLMTILIIVNTPLFIFMVYYFLKAHKYGKEADKYCPYCYTKDFKTTTLNTKKIRSYVKKEKHKDSNGNEKIKRILCEDWEGQYRNECCGKVYNRTWQEKINLDD